MVPAGPGARRGISTLRRRKEVVAEVEPEEFAHVGSIDVHRFAGEEFGERLLPVLQHVRLGLRVNLQGHRFFRAGGDGGVDGDDVIAFFTAWDNGGGGLTGC